MVLVIFVTPSEWIKNICIPTRIISQSDFVYLYHASFLRDIFQVKA